MSPKQWADAILPRLDIDRTFPDLLDIDRTFPDLLDDAGAPDMAAIRAVLADSYTTIVTGRDQTPSAREKGEFTGPANLTRSLSKHRQLREGVLSRLTRDHSRVEELIAMGLLHEGEVTDTRTANIITRAIGVEADFNPEIRAVELIAGDIVLLCSDGLNKVVDDAELGDTLRQGLPLAVDVLLELALSRAPTDNVTFGVIQALPEEPPTLVRG